MSIITKKTRRKTHLYTNRRKSIQFQIISNNTLALISTINIVLLFPNLQKHMKWTYKNLISFGKNCFRSILSDLGLPFGPSQCECYFREFHWAFHWAFQTSWASRWASHWAFQTSWASRWAFRRAFRWAFPVWIGCTDISSHNSGHLAALNSRHSRNNLRAWIVSRKSLLQKF